MTAPTPCPECGETINAVEVICKSGRCPACATPLDALFAAADDHESADIDYGPPASVDGGDA